MGSLTVLNILEGIEDLVTVSKFLNMLNSILYNLTLFTKFIDKIFLVLLIFYFKFKANRNIFELKFLFNFHLYVFILYISIKTLKINCKKMVLF